MKICSNGRKVFMSLCLPLLAVSGAYCAEDPVVTEVPAGYTVYSLPRTSLVVDVEVECRSFVAGPYAAYSERYLGVKSETEDSRTYRILSVSVRDKVEADPDARYVVDLSGNAKDFMKMTSQGLVVFSDASSAVADSRWRFRSEDVSGKDYGVSPVSNMDRKEVTLYQSVRTEEGIENIPVKQSQVVEKSAERKAREVAGLIFMLRQKKLDIITGDTDAVFDGEAMGAVLSEMKALEEYYIDLFTGRSSYTVMKYSFEVVPDGNVDRQMHVAFRFSENEGVFPSGNVEGRPIVLEIQNGNEISEPLCSEDLSAKKRIRTTDLVYYRIPETVSVRILDGQKCLVSAGIPMYQFGRCLSYHVGK